GLHPDGARQGPGQPARDLASRPPQRADPGRHGGRALASDAGGRRRPHRDGVRVAGDRTTRRRCRVRARLSGDHGRERDGGGRRHRRQSPDRPRLLRHRPADLVFMIGSAPAPTSGLGRLLRHRRGVLGGLAVMAMVVTGSLAPTLAPYSYSTQSLLQRLQPPSAAHWLGTAGFGRAVLSRTIWGGAGGPHRPQRVPEPARSRFRPGCPRAGRRARARPRTPRPRQRAARDRRADEPAAGPDDPHRVRPQLSRAGRAAAAAELGQHGGRGAPVPRVGVVDRHLSRARHLRHRARLQSLRGRTAGCVRSRALFRVVVIAKGGVTVIHAILFAVLVVALSLSGPGQGRAAGKDFVIGLSGDATSLNPVIATDSMSYTVEWPVFDSLVELDQKLNVRPLLAESWETSKDGLTYTFKLKKGVKWHDGKPFTARDVAFTFYSVLDPKVTTPHRAYFDALVGFPELTAKENPKRPEDLAVRPIEVVDDHTVRFRLRYPSGSF